MQLLTPNRDDYRSDGYGDGAPGTGNGDGMQASQIFGIGLGGDIFGGGSGDGSYDYGGDDGEGYCTEEFLDMSDLATALISLKVKPCACIC